MLPSSILDDVDVQTIERDDGARSDIERHDAAPVPNPLSDYEKRNLGDEGQQKLEHTPHGVLKSDEPGSEHLEPAILTEHDVQLKQEVVRMKEDFSARCGRLVRLIERQDRKATKLGTENCGLRFGVSHFFEEEKVPVASDPTEMDGILPGPTRHIPPSMTSAMPKQRQQGAKMSAHPSARPTILKNMRQKTGLERPVGGGLKAPPRVFIDADNLKAELKGKLSRKPYNVSQFYWNDGIAQRIARSSLFDTATTICIMLNALWIGVETDLNNASDLSEVEPVFVIVENLFCAYFLAEWAVRFCAFQRKANCFKDGWFVFDTFLVTLMVLETWVLGLIALIVGAAALPSFGAFRILRLTRMARMARLVNFFPEFAVMLKAITIGIRSVFWTVVFLCTVVYGFAIVFTQLLDGKNQPVGTVARDRFGKVGDSWATLLLLGALPDQASMMGEMGKIHLAYWLLMLIYLFFVSVTLMNMLTGTLVEVVRVISSVEGEEGKLTHLRQSLQDIMDDNDSDNNGMVSHQEFLGILTETKYAQVLNDLGIDVPGLLDLVDTIFEENSDQQLSFDDVTSVVFGLRDQNSATVKDLSEQSKMVIAEVRKLQRSNLTREQL